MYSWGFFFIMSATLFSLIVCKTQGNWKPRPAPGAFRAALAESRALLPYVAVAALVIVSIWVVLGLKFNEYSAPLILPLVMLALVLLDSGAVMRSRARPSLRYSGAVAPPRPAIQRCILEHCLR